MLCKRETAILKAKANIGGHRFSQVQHFSGKILTPRVHQA
jgi:hypothetical protein